MAAVALMVHQQVEAVAPITGISIGRVDDKTSWRITFADDATDEQRAAARAVVDTIDVSAGPVADTVTDVQFFHALAQIGTVTEAEALAAVTRGELPAALLAGIAKLPAEQQFAAKMMIAGGTVYHRSHPMVSALATAIGWTKEQTDNLWRSASAL